MKNDLVSDMLTRIRNANLARHSYTWINFSKLNIETLKVLQREGYIKNYQLKNINKAKKEIKVFLKYKGWWIKKPYFTIIRRISKPGQRIFAGYKDFDKIMDGLKYEQGTAIISTSRGGMSHLKAKAFKKGGEILCYIE